MSTNEGLWYAGRFSRRHGSHADIEVLAVDTAEGWAPIDNARKLFPKAGQVELLGVAVATVRAGDWLAFQVEALAKRRGAHSLTIAAYRMMPRYVDMAGMLGSIEAARSLFTNEGWAQGRIAGHWAVRFTEHRILVLDLVRGGDALRAAAQGLRRVPCYDFDPARIVPEPGAPDETELYDLPDGMPLMAHDWSADADYIAHVVRSLAGADDPRLEELIAWLELHRDDQTGRVSAIGADHAEAFEALRSGELAARLSTDKTVMAAYLAAVREDPAIAQVVAQAAAQTAVRNRDADLATLRSELTAEHEREKARQNEALRERERALMAAAEDCVKTKAAALERQLEEELRVAAREAAARAAARKEALEAEIAEMQGRRDEALAERNRIAADAAQVTVEVETLLEERHRLEGEVSRLTAAGLALAQRCELPTRSLVRLPEAPRGKPLPIERLASEISRSALLTPAGKTQMERFATFMLAGELPVLQGAQADDFALVAEGIIAAGGLVPLEIDSTILTPEDIWSRPGSGLMSPVAQAASRALEGSFTFLVQLRGIERSAARAWYPALAALVRRGLLSRRVLIFATIIDAASDEAQALPRDTCRMRIEEAIVPGASLVAPSILGSGPASIAFQLDPGPRPEDLSPGLSALVDLGSEADISMSLRVARVAVEALRLRPENPPAALGTARDFCASMGGAARNTG